MDVNSSSGTPQQLKQELQFGLEQMEEIVEEIGSPSGPGGGNARPARSGRGGKIYGGRVHGSRERAEVGPQISGRGTSPLGSGGTSSCSSSVVRRPTLACRCSFKIAGLNGPAVFGASGTSPITGTPSTSNGTACERDCKKRVRSSITSVTGVEQFLAGLDEEAADGGAS